MTGDIQFGATKLVGLVGVLSGAAIATGVPWVVLAYGPTGGLGSTAATILSTIGIIGGILVAALSAVSVVIPTRVGGAMEINERLGKPQPTA